MELIDWFRENYDGKCDLSGRTAGAHGTIYGQWADRHFDQRPPLEWFPACENRSGKKAYCIVWLAEKDQSAVGMGTVGFSVLDMPWDRNTLEQDRSFLRRTVEQAKMRRGWELLDYQPSEELLLPSLEKFLFLIAQLKQADIQPDCLDAWLAEAAENDPVRCGFPRCPKHHTLLTVFGCQICNHGSFG